jgi:hypothetical protein
LLGFCDPILVSFHGSEWQRTEVLVMADKHEAAPAGATAQLEAGSIKKKQLLFFFVLSYYQCHITIVQKTY